MDGHFRAFSFVDRITSIEVPTSVRGVYHIPGEIDSFPTPLAAEAVGQLAAWCAMAAVDFKVRPVAGIAASVELLSSVRPGQTLELSADLDTVDNEAISYCGLATTNGVPVVRLNHCVGPMVPQEEFDDINAVKKRFELLRGAGATPGAFGGVPKFDFTNVAREHGRWIRADLQVPAAAALFDDHFARRPVFPGTLFMEKILDLSSRLAAEIPASDNGDRWAAREIADGKLRKFVPPGDTLEYHAKIARLAGDSLIIAVEAKYDNRITGSGRIVFSREKNHAAAP